MKLSIIIPVYNAEKYLEACLDSCLAQAPFKVETDYEIICVNDGSTDQSQQILEKYKLKGVKAFMQENSGVSVARNTGLSHASGDYIWYVDADDLIHPNILSPVFSLIGEKQCTAFIFKYKGVPESFHINCCEAEINLIESTDRLTQISQNSTFSIIIARAFLLKHSLFFTQGMKYGEDTLWRYKIALYTNNIIATDQVLYYYRTVPTSATNVKTIAYRELWIESMKMMLTEYNSILNSYSSDEMVLSLSHLKERVYWVVQNILWGGLFISKEKAISNFYELKRTEFYPYPILWKRILSNKEVKKVLVQLFCALFPCKYYYLAIVYIINFKRKIVSRVN